MLQCKTMAYTLVDFRAEYPAFSQRSDADVQAAIDRVQAYHVTEDVWGAATDEATGVKTAVLLESDLYGHRSRPQNTGTSKYEQRWEELMLALPRATLAL